MWKKIVLGILIVLSGVAGFFVAKAQVTIYDSLNHMDRDYDTRLANVDLKDIDVNSDNEIVNILLCGVDARHDKAYWTDVGLSDSMMIATMDLKHGALKLTSLMRDMYVAIPDHDPQKLNAAYTFGQEELLYKTIATNFNIKLDGYVRVDLKGFTEIIDAIGGVDAELTESEAEYLNTTNYIRKKSDRNVKPGKQTLTGAQALGYCRIRKKCVSINGLTDDYARTWRQRTIISSVFDKVKTLPKTEWLSLANKMLKNVGTDLSNEDIIKYITDVVTMGATKIHQLQLPISGYYYGSSNYNGKGSCLVPTDGVSSEWTTVANAEALNQFIFNYDGKTNFTYGTYTSKED